MYQRIQEICKERNISISKLEADLGFPRGSIYKWNEHSPSVDKVKKLAEYLGIAMEELLKGEKGKE